MATRESLIHLEDEVLEVLLAKQAKQCRDTLKFIGYVQQDDF